ncbi:cytochrome C oxidase subunit IV family protein [Vicingaceae bacterium]|nr:cytochrome C oxidase subunit IV family protein [Vicingaceae bacterium]
MDISVSVNLLVLEASIVTTNLSTNGPNNESHSKGAIFVRVFAALCVLTAISFTIGNSPIMNRPAIGWTLMIGVSICKSVLVVAFFMHLRWETTWKYALTLPAIVMGILLTIVLVPDIGNRSAYSSRQSLEAGPHLNSTDDSTSETPIGVSD